MVGAFYVIFLFLLGCIIGSFLNVVIFRYHGGQSLNGRSYCFTCGKQLAWYELIPLLSFVIQRGRCRSCRSSISWQYFLVELATGLLFVAAFLKGYTDISLVFPLIALSLLVTIFAYDIRHTIIPDGLVYLFSGIAFLYAFVSFDPLILSFPSASALLAGPLLFLPFFCLWFFSRGTWMGLGDAKLALGIGWFLGLLGGLTAIILAFWVGAVVSLALLGIQYLAARKRTVLRKRFSFKSEIPFAPFLIIGFLMVFFFDIDIIMIVHFFDLRLSSLIM